MERLTNKREADAQREEYERRIANGYPRNIPEERFLRLAAYEDTHMMPLDVTSMRMDILARTGNSAMRRWRTMSTLTFWSRS